MVDAFGTLNARERFGGRLLNVVEGHVPSTILGDPSSTTKQWALAFIGQKAPISSEGQQSRQWRAAGTPREVHRGRKTRTMFRTKRPSCALTRSRPRMADDRTPLGVAQSD